MAAQAYLYGGMAALQLAGSYFASQNIRQTAELNRDIADMNAEFAELDAYDAEIQGITDQAKYQSVIDNTLAQQRASLAAADVDVNYGSAASIQEESKFIGELNKIEIEKRAQEQALGYKRQAREYRFGSELQYSQSMMQASQVMTSGVLGAVKTGATGYQRMQ